jgi:hypothetical protein
VIDELKKKLEFGSVLAAMNGECYTRGSILGNDAAVQRDER